MKNINRTNEQEIARIENNITGSVVDPNDEDLYVQEPLGLFLVKELISWIIIFAVAFGISLLINKFIIETTEVIGESMMPTLQPGEKLIINKLSYLFFKPQRGDVVVFLPDSEGKNYVKRVIGLPGETIDIKDGNVYINDQLLDESKYISDEVQTSKLYNSKIFPYTLGQEEYFVMGDNRTNSLDSRSDDIGAVTTMRMRGRVLFRIFPLKKMSIIHKVKYNLNVTD